MANEFVARNGLIILNGGLSLTGNTTMSGNTTIGGSLNVSGTTTSTNFVGNGSGLTGIAPLIYSAGTGTCSVVRCGVGNTAGGNCSASLAGSGNTASGNYSFVGGGVCNTVSGIESSIVGGQKNLVQGFNSFIGGGDCNNVCNSTSGCLSYGAVVAGGVGNNTSGGTFTLASCAFTVAPTICNAGSMSFVGGGFQNIASGACSAVLGGQGNVASGVFSGAFGCNLVASAACTFYVNNLCTTGISSAATCITSPLLCGTTSVNTPIVNSTNCVTATNLVSSALVCGTTSMCTPILRAGTACITGLSTSGCAVCVGASGLLTAYTAGGGGSIIVAGTGTNSTLRCGLSNTASAACSGVLAGSDNTACGIYSFVGGGFCNKATSCYSGTLSGRYNIASGAFSNISGGHANCALGAHSFVGGGTSNSACNTQTYIVGGNSNSISGPYSFIGAGYGNCLYQNGDGGNTYNCFNFIGMGGANAVYAGSYGAIVGGTNNSLGRPDGSYTNGCNDAYGAFIGGGISNTITGVFDDYGWRSSSVIVGGGGYGGPTQPTGNCICTTMYSIIGGGGTNYICGCFSGILGGKNNQITHNCSFIVGQGLSSSANNQTKVNVLSKASGTFEISHPDPTKNATKYLNHSFVESPTRGDNIYRYKITTCNCQASLPLPDYYKFLNENDQVWVSPVCHFGSGYGIVDSCQTCVSFTSNCDGDYNVLIIGTRKDADAILGWRGIETWK